jgi:hypothetical protein
MDRRRVNPSLDYSVVQVQLDFVFVRIFHRMSIVPPANQRNEYHAYHDGNGQKPAYDRHSDHQDRNDGSAGDHSSAAFGPKTALHSLLSKLSHGKILTPLGCVRQELRILSSIPEHCATNSSNSTCTFVIENFDAVHKRELNRDSAISIFTL